LLTTAALLAAASVSLATALLPAADAEPSPARSLPAPTLLRLRFTPNETIRQKLTIDAVADARVAGQMIQTTATQTLELALFVREIDADGIAAIQLTVARATCQVAVPAPVSRTFAFDSARRTDRAVPVSGGAPPELAEFLTALVGTRFELRVDARGEVLEFQTPEPSQDPLAKLSATQQFLDPAHPGGWRWLLGSSWFALPEENVAIDQEWTQTLSHESPPGEQRLTRTFRYRGADASRPELDRIDLREELQFVSGAEPTATAPRRRAAAIGTVLFDRSRGRLASIETATQFEPADIVPGGSSLQALRITTRLEQPE